MAENFLEVLRQKMDKYAHLTYAITKEFPRDELYGATSQLRRAALSVILNFIEGYARKRKAVKKNFWETSYGSLRESKYLFHFAFTEKYMAQEDYAGANKLAEEIGAMLWRALEPLSDDD